jgi:hypothetical protein
MSHPLAEKWRREAERDEQRGLKEFATFGRHFADDLNSWTKQYNEEELTLDEAAKESGYTKDHLFRLIYDRKLKNVGEPRSPRIQRQDLPRKPGYRTLPDPDPIGDALASQRT